ncbi:MAG TPA: hypothetical protein VHK88_02050 [Aquihabitans sp.]|jgi:hypothetical protein|nr:hypothetical protein [Aquihabitans sp.]
MSSQPTPEAADASPDVHLAEVPDAEPAPPNPWVSGRPADLLPGHRLVTITGGDLWMEAEAFVYEMYVKIGYTEPSPRHQVEELARWSDRSRFHAVLDEHDSVIGTIRTIFGSYAELPVSQFERTDHHDPDPVCEFSSLVVDPTQRSTGVIEHLYRAGWLDAWRSGSNAVVALIDDWLFQAFRDTYRLPFRKIGISQHYMGSDPVPVAMPLQGADYHDLAAENPQFWAWTLEALTAEEVRDWRLPIVLLDQPDDSPGQAVVQVEVPDGQAAGAGPAGS